MDTLDLRSQFTEDFFEEFQYDAEFRSIFIQISKGMSPYEAIEHLCKSKKGLMDYLKRVIDNSTPSRIIVTNEVFDKYKAEQNEMVK